VLIDVYQAEQMGQELHKQKMNVQTLAFTAAVKQGMATATLEAFTDHRIELWDDPVLTADLHRLRIVERPSGWCLDAPRTSAGHADAAVGLSWLCWPRRAAMSLPGPNSVRCN
jgi:hypothetical protein